MIALAQALIAAAARLDADADELTRLDSLQGDGDLGRTAGLVASALRRALQEYPDDSIKLLRACGTEIAATAPSSSGALIASAFMAAAKAVSESVDGVVVAGLQGGVDGIQHRGKAQPGDRTMLDALVPALLVLQATPSNLQGAAEAAERGIEATRTMEAKFGRARFLAGNAVGEPDPGAAMVGNALAAALRSA